MLPAREPTVAVTVTSPLRVPGVKTAVAVPLSSVTACAGEMPPESPSRVKSTATPATGVLLSGVLFSTCTVTVAVSPLPAVTHGVSAAIVISSGISAPAGAASRISPATRHA